MTDTIDPARHWAHCQCAACGQEEGLELPEAPAMTEPKHADYAMSEEADQ
ncbi:MAG: hypothetical protein ACRDTJ_09790 [Pseudonocardiaceae bacterium]